MKIIKKILFGFIFLALVSSLVAGYFGIVPGLSQVLGATKARDLGVKYTEENYEEYNSKAKYQVKTVSEQESQNPAVVFSGITNLNTGFSQEELSARLNYSEWKYMPVINTQIKINADKTVEFSGNLATDRLEGFIKSVAGIRETPPELEEALVYVKKIMPNPPIYIKFNAEVKNNDLSLNVLSLQVGRFNAPLEKYGGSGSLEEAAEDLIKRTPGLYIESLDFSEGKMNFKGTAPAGATMPSN